MVELKARLETAHHILPHILIHDYNAMQTAMQAYPDRIEVQPCGNPHVLIQGRDRRIPCPEIERNGRDIYSIEGTVG